MAAPAVVPAAVANPSDFDWHHPGVPDLTDATIRAALPDKLRVALTNVSHRFVAATPCLKWEKVLAPDPNDPAVGVSISQEQFDFLCMVGGIATAWLRQQQNPLLLSSVPKHGAGLFTALVLVGGCGSRQAIPHHPRSGGCSQAG